MNKVKILIVEDEVLISDYLVNYFTQSGYSFTAVVPSGEQALKSLATELPDIIIMDIKLEGELDGIQTANKISESLNIPLIYLTKYFDRKTIKKAKLTHPASYLTKPFNHRDLSIAIELALHNASNPSNNISTHEFQATKSFYLLNDRIFVKNTKNHFNKLELREILWIEADGAYTIIKTFNKDYTIAINLKTILSKIHHPSLIRVHRSFIVNFNRIESFIGKESLILNIDGITQGGSPNDNSNHNTKKIPVGKEYKDNLFKRIRFV